MSNIYSLGDTISITINPTDGTVSIPAQTIYTHSTYGEVIMCPIDFSTSKYSPNGTISGTIDESGVITLSSWGIFVKEGSYAGAYFNIFTSSSWVPTNATITSVKADGTEASYNVLVEQTTANEIRIINIIGNGAAVSALITSSKDVKISPQQLAYSSYYGYFYCYPIDASGKTVTNKPIVGAGTESSITLGPWAVTVRDYTTYVLYKYASSTITITSPVITYPEDLNISFTGEGTADSPYIISTATELQMLSQSVADGNTYKGKYFKQTANIDLSSLTSSYIPVGDTSTSFEAAYDGGNYTISNLTLDRKGFSNSGIFGYLGENATVTNLNIDGFSLAASGTNLGVLAGINYGTISNCHITNSTIEANCEIAGGIAGVSYGTITNSSFSGNVYNIGIVGGIVGQNLGIISSSYATGLVSLTGYYSSTAHYAGGLAGFSSPAVENGCKITDSYFSGEVADNYGYGIIGGLIGAFLNADMERCFTVGMVVAGDDTAENTTTGGLFGFLSKANITDCYNAATVVKTASGNENVGGIAGYISVTYLNGVTINNLSNIKNCYNSGLINSSSTHSRSGLFGTTFVFNNIDPIEYTFTNSYSDSQITGLEHETYGKQTSYFIGGTLPEGFSSDVWEAVSGSYPTLKSISDCAAKQLSAASISLSNDETMRKVKSQFTLNTPSSNIKWGIYNNKQISTSSDALTISGTTVSIKDIYSTEPILS